MEYLREGNHYIVNLEYLNPYLRRAYLAEKPDTVPHDPPPDYNGVRSPDRIDLEIYMREHVGKLNRVDAYQIAAEIKIPIIRVRDMLRAMYKAGGISRIIGPKRWRLNSHGRRNYEYWTPRRRRPVDPRR